MATTGRTQKSPRTPAAPNPAKLSPEAERWVAQTLKKMSLDEKIGQVFAVWAYGSFLSTESHDYHDLLRDVEEKHIGSFAIQTQGSPLGIERSQVYPDRGPGQHAAKPRQGSAAGRPRISSAARPCASRKARRFPHAMAVAATGRPEDAYTMGKITALEGKSGGRSLDFCARRGRQQQSRQSHHQHALVRRRSRARLRICRRLRARRRGKRRPRHGETFPRPRRYQHRFASRSADRDQRPRASGPRRARPVPRSHCRRRRAPS